MTDKCYKIGELARLSGVSAKTIRFYSDIGALPPTAVTAAGYRLYDDADRGRLETIRALREIGVALPTIIDLLRDKVSAAQVLSVQLDALDLTLRAVRRQRAVLRAALGQGEAGALAYLDRARALARFDARERQEFLAARMEQVFAGVRANEGWKGWFWQGAVLDLPEELSEEQFTAWLELAELVSDESFIRRSNEIGRESWNRPHATTDESPAPTALYDLYLEIAEAQRAGHTPGDARGQELIDRYLELQARTFGKSATAPEFVPELLALIERNTDPRAARYWELIAIIKGWAPSPIADAHRWLVAGLHARVAGDHPCAQPCAIEETAARHAERRAGRS